MKSFGKFAFVTSLITACLILLGFANPAGAVTGNLDRGFGDQGVTQVAPSIGEAQTSQAVAKQSDGKLVVAGSDEANGRSILARFTGTGELDRTFGDQGVVKTPGDGWTGLDIGKNDRILVSGSDGSDAVIARFAANGSPDVNFGSGGTYRFDPAPLRAAEFAGLPTQISLNAVRELDGGGVRAIGTFFECKVDYDPQCPNLIAFGLAADGTPDPAYGNSGHRVLPQTGESAAALIRSDGSAYIVRDTNEEAAVGLDFFFTASRIDATGDEVEGYGGTSRALGASLGDTNGVITLDNEGRLYVVAYNELVRFKKNGRAGSNFEMRLSNFVRGIGFRIGGITVDAKDRILVSGGFVKKKSEGGRRPGAFLARMAENGRPDPTFASDGLAVAWFGPVSAAQRRLPKSGAPLIATGNSRIVVAGELPDGNRSSIRLARFEAGESPAYDCGGKPAGFIGTSGKDEVRNGYGGTIVTLGGDDKVSDVGVSRICTGSGDDVINVSEYLERPEVWAGSGDDVVRGSDQGNVTHGGSGKDRIRGGDQNDDIDGGPGADTIRGGKWDDRLSGGSGDDSLSGGTGRDQLEGGPGIDRLLPGPTGPLVRKYSGKYRGISTEVVREGGEATFSFDLTLRCSGNEKRSTSAGVKTPVKRSGRVREIAPPSRREVYDIAFFTDVTGRFTDHGVKGQVGSVESDHWSDNYTCFTGKSVKDLWEPFKADLKPQVRQFAHQ